MEFGIKIALYNSGNFFRRKNMNKLGKYSRGVSIIGVGCTPFVNSLKHPDFQGITESELYAYAAIEAMKDAGIGPKDLQGFIHGQAGAVPTSNQNTPNVHVSEWFGAHGLGSIAHSEACCTGYIGLDLAVQGVASGKYDIMLSGCVDMGTSIFQKGKPAQFREKLTREGFQEMVERVYDRTYVQQLEAGEWVSQDDWFNEYMRTYGYSEKYVDDGLNALTISNRRNASKNPLALFRTEFEDMAKIAGYDDVMEYMRSDEHNPLVSRYLRRNGFEARADGAAACIVCPTEFAHKYTDNPIEILGFGNSVVDAINPHLEREATAEAMRLVYDVTGVKPDEIDLLLVNDFFVSSSFLAAEESGYIPRGKVVEYALAGRLAFDGDKPMNTTGGRCSFGHAHAASGMADIYEAVMQMRGNAGERQIKNKPRTVMLRGYGGGQNVCAGILRTVK